MGYDKLAFHSLCLPLLWDKGVSFMYVCIHHCLPHHRDVVQYHYSFDQTIRVDSSEKENNNYSQNKYS